MEFDLHCHTNASDGEFTPIQTIKWAMKKGLKAIAITDHDTLSSLSEAISFSKGKNIEFIPGIEISCSEDSLDVEDLHVVGLFVNPENKALIKMTKTLQEARNNQKQEITKKLNELGFNISLKEIFKEANGGILGRLHIAKILIRKYPKKYKNTDKVFQELLGRGGKAFVKQKKFPLKKVIKTINNAGGISILAHPGLIGKNAERIIDKFLEMGGQGIEIDYPYRYSDKFNEKESKNLIWKFKKIAHKKGLLISGGSDFHSKDKLVEIGEFGINNREFKNLKSIKNNNNNQDGKINDL